MLNFSDKEMRHFFGVMDIEIFADAYAKNGTSKGNRLRTFLRAVDDQTAVRVLQALWQNRVEFLESTGRDDPVARAEERFLTMLQRLGGGLGSGAPPVAPPAPEGSAQDELKDELIRIRDMPAQARGYAFEAFLTKAFKMSGLEPREPFRNTGEQIDGSFVLDGEVYLVEAKWRGKLTDAQSLNGFHGKLLGKADWARGLFVSFSGSTDEALAAFHGRRTVFMSGKDIHDLLDGRIPLMSVLRAKVRAAGETGRLFIRVVELFPRKV